MYRIENGIAKYNASPLIPELQNEYRLSKNRRKSNKTLPPFSREYVVKRFAINNYFA